MAGVGVHHAGLLPKYRLLVERLAQAGLLKIICGTDTLGVGVNVPIRSVLFTQLCKYDGSSVRLLRVREFQQIAGRAGRRGFDDRGDVWAQAPEHVVDNQRMAEQAETDAKKRKKMVKKKAPDRGYAHWDEGTFDRLVSGDPEPLTSSFDVNHQMVMSLLDRPGDGCGAVRRLMVENHETRKRQREHIRRTIAIYRSLADANLLEFPDPPDDQGRRVRVNFDLQDEFALHQPLSLWAIDAITHLDRELHVEVRTPHQPRRTERKREQPARAEPAADGAFAGLAEMLDLADAEDQVDDAETDGETDGEVEMPDHRGATPADGSSSDEPSSDGDAAEVVTVAVGATGDIDRSLAILTIIEAVQENPAVVIAAQLRKAKDALMSEMKSSGVEYEERMERLSKVEPPRPLKDWLYGDFNEFRRHHPWVGGDTVKPKSVVRDLFERAMTFGEYIDHYGLKNSEGVVLRYVSDVYKGLIQNVPAEAGSEELDEIIHWLGALVRQVDSSLLDEWERLQNPDGEDDRGASRPRTTRRADDDHDRRPSVSDHGAQRGVPLGRAPGSSASPAECRRRPRRQRGDGGVLVGVRRHRRRRRCSTFVTVRHSTPPRGRIEQTLHDPDGQRRLAADRPGRSRRVASRRSSRRITGRHRPSGMTRSSRAVCGTSRRDRVPGPTGPSLGG